jgi:hypothetical protein
MMRFLAQDACNEPSNATYKHGLDGETSELIEVWHHAIIFLKFQPSS